MAVTSASCPECGARITFKQSVAAGKKVQCRRCETVFRVAEEEEAPRAGMRRTKHAPAAGGVPLAVYLGAGVLLVALVAVVAVLALGGGSGHGGGQSGPPPQGGLTPVPDSGGGDGGQRGGPVILGDPAKVTLANFQQVRPGTSLPHVQALLGTGSPSSDAELHSDWLTATKPLDAKMEQGRALSSPAEKFYAWRTAELTVFIGFGKDARGVERAAYSSWVQRLPGGGHQTGHGMWMARAGVDLGKLGAERDEEHRIFNDTQLKKGAEARQLLVGEWWQGDTQQGRIFSADGSFQNPGIENFAGQYRFIGDDLLELSFHLTTLNKQVTERYKVRVGQEELHLFLQPDATTLVKRGPLYRRRPGGGGLWQAKVVAPLFESLRAPDADTRLKAEYTLERMGPRGDFAVAALVDRLTDDSAKVRAQTVRTLKAIGPASKAALPRLIPLLRDREGQVVRETCYLLATLGPEARAALPELRALVKGGGPYTREAQGAIQSIEK